MFLIIIYYRQFIDGIGQVNKKQWDAPRSILLLLSDFYSYLERQLWTIKILYSRVSTTCPEEGAIGASRSSTQGRAVPTVTRRFSRITRVSARWFETRRAFANAIFFENGLNDFRITFFKRYYFCLNKMIVPCL